MVLLVPLMYRYELRLLRMAGSRRKQLSQAFPGMINGGIIGTLLDCHGNWTAAVALMDQDGSDEPPCTVTASYSVQLRRPTPIDTELHITSQVVSIEGNKVNVELLMEAEGKVCATGKGLFVAVTEGHPAYHRWS